MSKMPKVTKVLKVDEYLQELLQSGYAAGTIENRRIYLEQFFFFLQRQKNYNLNRETIYQYQVKLSKEKITALTLRDKLSALNLFLTWLFKSGYLLFDLSAAINFPKSEIYLPKRIMSESEVKYFLSLPDTKTRKGIRDKAILELLYSAAIRRAELVGLNLYDLNVDEQTIRVLGKGRKERTVPVGDTALYWLLKYIDEVRKPASFKESALFLGLAGGKRLKAKMLNLVISEYAKESRLNKRITPHTFRHSCATHLLKNDADIRHVQELLGHESPTTTQVYTRVVIADLQKAFRETHPRAKRK